MKIDVLIDISALREPDIVVALKGLPECVREKFRSFLFHGFIQAGHKVVPRTEFRVAGGANDNGAALRFFWDLDFVITALAAAQNGGERNVDFVAHNPPFWWQIVPLSIDGGNAPAMCA